MKKMITMLSILLISLTSFTNCYGSFKLVKKLHIMVGSVNNKWISSVIVILVYLVPIILWVTYILDIVVFNLIEFWSGSNPISNSDYDENGTAVKEFSQDNVTLKLTYLKFGKEMQIQTFNNGIQDGENIIVNKDEPGVLYKQEITGELTKVDSKNIKLTRAQYAQVQLKLDNMKVMY